MLTERITLPELDDQPGVEQWAEIRAVKELRAGDRKAVRKAFKLEISDSGGVQKSFSMADEDEQREVLLTRIIVQWSLPKDYPLPRLDPGVFDRLPLDVYDALVDATEEHWSVVDFSPKPNPAGTGSSSGSGTGAAATSSPDSSPTPA